LRSSAALGRFPVSWMGCTGNSKAKPPASRIPSRTRSASWRWWRLHGDRSGARLGDPDDRPSGLQLRPREPPVQVPLDVHGRHPRVVGVVEPLLAAQQTGRTPCVLTHRSSLASGRPLRLVGNGSSDMWSVANLRSWWGPVKVALVALVRRPRVRVSEPARPPGARRHQAGPSAVPLPTTCTRCRGRRWCGPSSGPVCSADGPPSARSAQCASIVLPLLQRPARLTHAQKFHIEPFTPPDYCCMARFAIAVSLSLTQTRFRYTTRELLEGAVLPSIGRPGVTFLHGGRTMRTHAVFFASPPVFRGSEAAPMPGRPTRPAKSPDLETRMVPGLSSKPARARASGAVRDRLRDHPSPGSGARCARTP
jgi:hypothetical protein